MKRADAIRLAAKRRMAARRVAFRMQGLTSNGTPRKLKIWPKHLFYGCHNETDKNRIRRQINRAANIAAGLRHDGQPRKSYSWPELAGLTGRDRKLRRQVLTMRRRYAEQRKTPLDRAWQTFRATCPEPVEGTFVLPVGRDSVEPALSLPNEP